jgi:hypothetical protein
VGKRILHTITECILMGLAVGLLIIFLAFAWGLLNSGGL